MTSRDWGIAIGLLIGMTAASVAGFRALRRRQRPVMLDEARQLFQKRREWFEVRFFELASRSGKPRGLEWVSCDFQPEVTFARQKATGHLQALVGVIVRFRAVEGGDMEDNPNVANLRDATAVFSFVGRDWDTDGRVVFNLSPAQTIERFQHELELVE